MWQRRQAELLEQEIDNVLHPLADVPGLYELAKEPLTKDRRGLEW